MNWALPWSRPMCAVLPATAKPTWRSTTACCARMRSKTSARCWCGSACRNPRREASGGFRRLLRRLSRARDAGQFQRAPARRRRRGGHRRLRQLSDQHRAVSPESAPRGIRRRTRSRHARIPAADFAADQCGSHFAAAARRAWQERSAGAASAKRSRSSIESAARAATSGICRRPTKATVFGKSRTATPTTERSRSS